MRSRSRASAVVLTLVTILVLSGCSGSDEGSGTGDPPGEAAQGATETPPVSSRATCAVPDLIIPIVAQHPGATIDHIACRERQAVVTVVGGEGIRGQAVGYLFSDGTSWSLAGTGSFDPDLAQLTRPPELRDDVFEQWRQSSARLPPAPPRPLPDPDAPTTVKTTTTTIVVPPGCTDENPDCVGE